MYVSLSSLLRDWRELERENDLLSCIVAPKQATDGNSSPESWGHIPHSLWISMLALLVRLALVLSKGVELKTYPRAQEISDHLKRSWARRGKVTFYSRIPAWWFRWGAPSVNVLGTVEGMQTIHSIITRIGTPPTDTEKTRSGEGLESMRECQLNKRRKITVNAYYYSFCLHHSYPSPQTLAYLYVTTLLYLMCLIFFPAGLPLSMQSLGHVKIPL